MDEQIPSDAEIDALLETDNTPNERPMEGGDNLEAPAEQAAPTPAQQAEAMKYSFNHGGKTVEATQDQLIKWAQMGYDYPQKMEALNKQRQEFEALKPYQEIDAYAKANPQWWAQVNQAWQNKEQMGQQQGQVNPNDPVMQHVNQLSGKLNEAMSFIEQQKQERQQAQIAKEDQELDNEVKSIREKYSDLDWANIDQTGYNLERRVLHYAAENGIKKFADAFKAYNHDTLVQRAEERGKEKIGQDIQKKTKLGLLGKTPTPTMGLKDVGNVKNKSYNQIEAEILQELGIG